MKLISILAIGIGVGFWLGNMYTYGEVLDLLESSDGNPNAVTNETPSPKNGSVSKEDAAVRPSIEGGVTISTAALSDTQRALLSKLGISGETIVITPQMIACAEGKLGEQRIDEIVAGAEPTPIELVQVAPCL